MTNLGDFLKCEKVQATNECHKDLSPFKTYQILGVNEIFLFVIDDLGNRDGYPFHNFELVIETAIQATDSLDDTPMRTRTINEFKVGDMVYWATNPEIYTIHRINNHVIELMWNEDCETAYLKEICHATQDNYERLSATFDIIEFEKPKQELTGSDLCRAKLKQGEINISCYVGNSGDSTDNKRAIVSGYNNSGQFYTDFGLFNNAVPFDPKTGQVLTSEVLDDQ